MTDRNLYGEIWVIRDEPTIVWAIFAKIYSRDTLTKCRPRRLNSVSSRISELSSITSTAWRGWDQSRVKCKQTAERDTTFCGRPSSWGWGTFWTRRTSRRGNPWSGRGRKHRNDRVVSDAGRRWHGGSRTAEWLSRSDGNYTRWRDLYPWYTTCGQPNRTWYPNGLRAIVRSGIPPRNRRDASSDRGSNRIVNRVLNVISNSSIHR